MSNCVFDNPYNNRINQRLNEMDQQHDFGPKLMQFRVSAPLSGSIGMSGGARSSAYILNGTNNGGYPTAAQLSYSIPRSAYSQVIESPYVGGKSSFNLKGLDNQTKGLQNAVLKNLENKIVALGRPRGGKSAFNLSGLDKQTKGLQNAVLKNLENKIVALGRKPSMPSVSQMYNHAKTAARTMQRAAKSPAGKFASRAAIDYGTPVAMGAVASMTGQPEIMAATPFVKSAAKSALDHYGYGRGAVRSTVVRTGGAMSRQQRGALVSKIMREKGMTLGQASSYIKNNM